MSGVGVGDGFEQRFKISQYKLERFQEEMSGKEVGKKWERSGKEVGKKCLKVSEEMY